MENKKRLNETAQVENLVPVKQPAAYTPKSTSQRAILFVSYETEEELQKLKERPEVYAAYDELTAHDSVYALAHMEAWLKKKSRS